NGLGDVVDHPTVHAKALGPSHAHHFDLPIFVLLSDDRHDLGGSYVQPHRIITLFHILNFGANHLIVEFQTHYCVFFQGIVLGGLDVIGHKIFKLQIEIVHSAQVHHKIFGAEPELVVPNLLQVDANDILDEKIIGIDIVQD